MADAVGAIKVHTSTGDIHIEGASADEMALSVSTGHIDAEDITCAKDMTVRVSTGKIALQEGYLGIAVELAYVLYILSRLLYLCTAKPQTDVLSDTAPESEPTTES